MPTEAYALCPMPARVPHVTEKGYILILLQFKSNHFHIQIEVNSQELILLPKLEKINPNPAVNP
jgi:hypothetical protein